MTYNNITKSELEGLAKIQCTVEEMCNYFGCSRDVIENRIREHYDLRPKQFIDQYASHGKVALRRKLMQKALKGDWPALNKALDHYLGMHDKTKMEHTGAGGGPVSVEQTLKAMSTEQLLQLEAIAESLKEPE